MAVHLRGRETMSDLYGRHDEAPLVSSGVFRHRPSRRYAFSLAALAFISGLEAAEVGRTSETCGTGSKCASNYNPYPYQPDEQGWPVLPTPLARSTTFVSGVSGAVGVSGMCI
jgi:hypothetical protein